MPDDFRGVYRIGRQSLFIPLVVLCTMLGCTGNGGPKTVPVSGVVNYKGEPVSGAGVTFSPPEGRPAIGTTDENGRFELVTSVTRHGAVPGEYAVTIVKMETRDPQVAEDARPGQRLPPLENLLPGKYAEPTASDLQVTVTASGPNKFEFDLSDD